LWGDEVILPKTGEEPYYYYSPVEKHMRYSIKETFSTVIVPTFPTASLFTVDFAPELIVLPLERSFGQMEYN